MAVIPKFMGERIKLSHRRVSRGNDTLNVIDESMLIQIGTASAVGSSEVLGIMAKNLASQ